MTPHESEAARPIAKLRNLILVCLVLGVGAFTAVMFTIASELSSRFGRQVESDLRWRVSRGAQELSRSTELGLALADESMVRSAFGVYAQSDDVQAIVATAADGRVIAQHGAAPEAPRQLLRGAAGALRAEHGYLVSWANVEIEGVPVGKVAMVVSTRRHSDALSLLTHSKLTVLIGGLLALLLGGVAVTFFTRAVAQRDLQLSDYAKNLERKVEARTRELDERNRGMRLVLDNVAQGFITIDLDGVMASERSAVLNRWFSLPTPGMRITDYLAEVAPDFASWLGLGLEQLRDDFLPAALTIDQLPRRFEGYGRTFDVTYTAIERELRVAHLLVIISDVTEALARERAEREQRELVALFQRISADRTGVEEFVREAASLVAALRCERDPTVQQRLVHTLKGNCAIYGLESYAQLAHNIESELAADQTGLSAGQQGLLVNMWKDAMRRVSKLLGSTRRDVIEIERNELEELRARAQADSHGIDILALLTHWSLDPIEPRLMRLAQQASALAQRLDKPEPKITINASGIRVSSVGFSAFWSALVHVVRNAMDHGIESAEQRLLLGKPEAGSLELSATRTEGTLVIRLRDDGAGIQWDHIRKKAQAAGLPHQSHEDLIAALFSDGLSTKEEASDVSGRGVGLAALRDTVRELGGRIEVSSQLGSGTCFSFSFEEQSIARSSRKGRDSLSSLLPRFS
jgi:signal transduction histidine kinase